MSPGVSRYRAEVRALVAGGVAVTSGTQLFLRRTRRTDGRRHRQQGQVDRDPAGARTCCRRPAARSSPRQHRGAAARPPAGPARRRRGGRGVELSGGAGDLAAAVAVLTSLFPDHLPWHGGVERYYARQAAARSRRSCRAGQRRGSGGAASGLADRDAARAAPTRLRPVPTPTVVGAWSGGRRRGGRRIAAGAAAAPLATAGAHNALNVAGSRRRPGRARHDVVRLSGRLEDALARFAPLPHRLEPVPSSPT